MSPKCSMPNFKLFRLLVLKKIFEGFCHIWACQPSWSCDLNHYLVKRYVPLQIEAAKTKLALIGQAVSKKMFENIVHLYMYPQVKSFS